VDGQESEVHLRCHRHLGHYFVVIAQKKEYAVVAKIVAVAVVLVLAADGVSTTTALEVGGVETAGWQAKMMLVGNLTGETRHWRMCLGFGTSS
jgi:cobyrinic acid a,c-diamide synthase